MLRASAKAHAGHASSSSSSLTPLVAMFYDTRYNEKDKIFQMMKALNFTFTVGPSRNTSSAQRHKVNMQAEGLQMVDKNFSPGQRVRHLLDTLPGVESSASLVIVLDTDMVPLCSVDELVALRLSLIHI